MPKKMLTVTTVGEVKKSGLGFACFSLGSLGVVGVWSPVKLPDSLKNARSPNARGICRRRMLHISLDDPVWSKNFPAIVPVDHQSTKSFDM
jgi:hypothetical protein